MLQYFLETIMFIYVYFLRNQFFVSIFAEEIILSIFALQACTEGSKQASKAL